ncbi:hypothetical protein [Roseovarius sp. M141]|uniref:hypothetical protein n=1 Tax=Roseovarius sp. M141 TaxID=2583806 RepID=UPI0020CEE46C|nr:hypothetical protein [Roseovarius sp. M141]MCQ0094220.1 hypothetical protein [Roseovarius sp. M141]
MFTGKINTVADFLFLMMLMPLGILTEVIFDAPPFFVITGGISMVLAMGWLTVAVWQAEAIQ